MAEMMLFDLVVLIGLALSIWIVVPVSLPKKEIPFEWGWAFFYRCGVCDELIRERNMGRVVQKPKRRGVSTIGDTCGRCHSTTHKTHISFPASYLILRDRGEEYLDG